MRSTHRLLDTRITVRGTNPTGFCLSLNNRLLIELPVQRRPFSNEPRRDGRAAACLAAKDGVLPRLNYSSCLRAFVVASFDLPLLLPRPCHKAASGKRPIPLALYRAYLLPAEDSPRRHEAFLIKTSEFILRVFASSWLQDFDLPRPSSLVPRPSSFNAAKRAVLAPAAPATLRSGR